MDRCAPARCQRPNAFELKRVDSHSGGALLVPAAFLAAASPGSTDVKIPLDSPISRFLLDPVGTLVGWASSLLDRAAALGPKAGAIALLILIILAGVQLGLGRWRLARLHQGARLVEILTPPNVDPGGAEALWRNLHGLLRSGRPLLGRPHVVWEYRWHQERLAIGLWLPGMVAPRLAEQAIQAAWPAARTHTIPSSPAPLPPEATRVRGGALRLAAPEWYSLRTEP